MFFACSFLFAAACFSLSGRLRLFRCAGITLAFPFFAFSSEGEKREKTYGSGNPCRIAVLRQSRQVECAKPLAFPFGQASPVPLHRHYPCFPLRESLPNCRFKAISASRVAQGAERGQFKFRPFFQALSLLIFLAKKFAKLSATSWLPLACIKFSATTRLPLLPA